MAARPQWYLASIGSTNSVQPYCRFAIIAMQAMPIASCSQRKELPSGARAVAVASVVAFIFPPGPRCSFLFKRQVQAYWYVLCQSASHANGHNATRNLPHLDEGFERGGDRRKKAPEDHPGPLSWEAVVKVKLGAAPSGAGARGNQRPK